MSWVGIIKMSRYKIFDGEEYRNFDGLVVQYKELFEIVFEFDTIEATAEHRFLTLADEWVSVDNLSTSDILIGAGRFISKRSIGADNVYDPLNVESSNKYQTNNAISHNCSLVYIDECAFVEHFDEFYSSVYPTIASGKDTKILFTSTPNGLNFFYKFWTEAKEERNGFKWVEVAWDKVPGRDDAWKIETLSGMNHDYEQFEVEFNCQFAGSSGTLLSGSSLKALVHQTPI